MAVAGPGRPAEFVALVGGRHVRAVGDYAQFPTFRENGTHGTDHGHGSAHWVLGGAVHGGRFVGDQVAVTPKTLNQNRDLPVLTEYRAMLDGIFRHMYSLDNTRIAHVFPNAAPLELGLV